MLTIVLGIGAFLVILAVNIAGDWHSHKIATSRPTVADDSDLDLHDWTPEELAELDAELNAE
jgi:hypothetical protein